MEPDIRILLQIIVACVLAGILGWERESAGKAAGLRTHILVGVAAAMFIVIGESMAASFRIYGDHVRFDAANLIGAIVTGISFLGAGMIIFRKGRSGIEGLTTAAGILTTAAIGMMVGLERYVLAAGSTLIVFIVLRFVSWIEPRGNKKKLASAGPPKEEK
ncbi:MgtC/SapB family protein [Leptolyngbya sp. 7M]|uniref:MgtC/SapB family protein n=1 Tax=Leptolyngbya sp. 7M TaxID=2812896 RepID=UPI001B8B0DA0|nr:MgtC/SapB family protein [Leptolyngbya sp. 7M]QYO65738.1 MgtC/SapB family protein [Leptolyngbya sp. 7M]